MKKVNIKVDIKADELKKKLNIRDGKDGEKGEKGDDGFSPDPKDIALEASTIALEKIKPLVPTPEQVLNNLPIVGERVRDSLELIEEEKDKLKIEAVGYLREELDEITKLAKKKEKKQVTVVSGNGLRNLQEVTDVGSVTTNSIEAQSFITTGGDNTEVVAGDGTLIPLPSIVEDYVPYTGATTDVDLGQNDITASNGIFPVTTSDNLVTNGDFADGSVWSVGAGWVISGGKCSHTTSSFAVVSQTGLDIAAQDVVLLTFDVLDYTSGSVTFTVGGTTATTRSANGTYSEYLVITSGTTISFNIASPANRLAVDNIVLQKITNGTFSAKGKTIELGTAGTALIMGDISGNNRGAAAFDFQINRTAVTQVAASPNSFVTGSQNTIDVQVGKYHYINGIGNRIMSTATFITTGQAFVQGTYNTIGGYGDVVTGSDNIVNSLGAFDSLGIVYGRLNNVQGSSTIAYGTGLQMAGSALLALGTNCVNTGGGATTIGTGVGAHNRDVVAIGLNQGTNGTYGDGGVAIGSYGAANGNQSIAQGFRSRVGCSPISITNTPNSANCSVSGNLTDELANSDTLAFNWTLDGVRKAYVTKTISSVTWTSPNTTFSIGSYLSPSGTSITAWTVATNKAARGTAHGYYAISLGIGSSVYGGGGNSTNAIFTRVDGQNMIGPSQTVFQTITHSTASYGYRTQNPSTKFHILADNLLITDDASLGSEKLTNGTFTGNATGWTLNTGYAYSSNTVLHNADGTGTLLQTSAGMVTPLVVGETYLLTYTISNWTVGSVTAACGGRTGQTHNKLEVSQTGNSSFTFTDVFYNIASTADLTFTPTSTARFTIDTISLKKITGGSLTAIGAVKSGSLQTSAITNDTGLASGVYTPTITAVTNIAASTAYECHYMRVGNTVTVHGKVDLDQTAAGAYEVGISLPVASNFAATTDLSGDGESINAVGISDAPYLEADTTNDRASFKGSDTDVGNHPHYFHFMYRVI